jgi:hypothetical protein
MVTPQFGELGRLPRPNGKDYRRSPAHLVIERFVLLRQRVEFLGQLSQALLQQIVGASGQGTEGDDAQPAQAGKCPLEKLLLYPLGGATPPATRLKRRTGVPRRRPRHAMSRRRCRARQPMDSMAFAESSVRTGGWP